MKQCAVIETSLDIVPPLRAAGLKSKVAFVSSNIRDHVGETHEMPNPHLGEDFIWVGMEHPEP
jgi:hypothetical protein